MNCARCGAIISATVGACPSCGQTVAGAVSRTSYRTTLVLVLGGIAVLAALALWGAVALPPLISKAASTLNAAVAPIERQLDALRHGDLRAAYDETSQDFRRTTSFASFEAFVARVPALSRNAGHNFTNRKVNWTNASGTGLVSGTLSDASGGTVQVEYKLVTEGTAWRINAINVKSGST